MGGVLTGFAIISAVIALGYVIQRTGLLGEDTSRPLSRLIYFVLSPALLFTVMIDADLHVVFSRSMIVTVSTIAIGAIIYVTASRLFFRRSLPETMIGMLGAVQSNSSNIGLPVALYVLGGGQYVAPLILFQTVVLTPISLVILDLSTQAKVSIRTILLQPFRNPAIIAALGGFALSLANLDIPEPVLEPLTLVGGAAIPMFLMTFGMALHGQRPFRPTPGSRAELTVAVAIKVGLMPLCAYLLGRFGFDLSDPQLFTVVVLAALPSAQNVYNFAVRFGHAQTLAVSIVTLTTVLAMPVLVITAVFLGS